MSLAEGFPWDRRVSQALAEPQEQPSSPFPWRCVRPGAAAGTGLAGWEAAG